MSFTGFCGGTSAGGPTLYPDGLPRIGCIRGRAIAGGGADRSPDGYRPQKGGSTAGKQEENMNVTRRHFMGGVAGLATYGAFGGGQVFAAAQKPSSPLTITIVDVAGNLALTQGAFDAYAAAKPDFVSRFAYT